MNLSSASASDTSHFPGGPHLITYLKQSLLSGFSSYTNGDGIRSLGWWCCEVPLATPKSKSNNQNNQPQRKQLTLLV